MSMQTMEKNRLQTLPKALASSIKPVLTVFKNELGYINNKQAAALVGVAPINKESGYHRLC